ncbi:glycosyltransferase family 2 protein [Celeribacter litoreus]|uniref:glycosyltransferase family 2 protein n=1 Tax=Celeribacter litoreus TaxID=2876714 RepID=UPI001CCC62BA|nr:glycosyltransferase family 2 protein [Celeribacter litoreus]MCA0045091.1 glycosyltransferase family 2 protein [Celeribacter litoreus]
MKLIIQIPALNEEGTIAETLAALPKSMPGFEVIEVLLIDDGSTDDTVDIARTAGVDHVLSMGTNMGLARAFAAGLEEAIRLGADVIVNTDADNQYCADDIPALVRPIVDNEAQIVVGARPIKENESFSPLKKQLQSLGSWVVRRASGSDIPDAPSGFRAYSREAAARLCVLTTYTYTLETIIQAGRKRIPMTSVPVRVNKVERPSRLFRSMGGYIRRSIATILRVFVLYAPLRFFLMLAGVTALPALVVIARFLWFVANGDGAGHVQSLVLAGALMAMIFFAVGVLADLIAANRTLLEDNRSRDLLRNEGAPRTDRRRIRVIKD